LEERRRRRTHRKQNWARKTRYTHRDELEIDNKREIGPVVGALSCSITTTSQQLKTQE